MQRTLQLCRFCQTSVRPRSRPASWPVAFFATSAARWRPDIDIDHSQSSIRQAFQSDSAGNFSNGSVNEKASKSFMAARGTLVRLKKREGQGKDNAGIDDVVLERTGKLGKLQTCKEFGLQPRDLGALDVDVAGQRAQIFVRPGSIVYSVSTHAVIRSDKMLYLERVEPEKEGSDGKRTPDALDTEDAKDFTPLIKRLQFEMRKIIVKDKLAQPDETATVEAAGSTPFEFLALEALLAETTRVLLADSEGLQERFNTLMNTLSTTDTIPTTALQSMLEIKDSAEDFKSRADDFKAAVTAVLSEEQDMADMYLTDIAKGSPRQIGNDDEVELLLETYRHHAYSLTAAANTLLSRLQSVNNHVTLLLSSTRNRLLNLEITVAFATLGMGVAAYVGAIFGMNLKSGLEDEPHFFAGMTLFSILLAGGIMRAGRTLLVRARSMKGENYRILKEPALRTRPPRNVKMPVEENKIAAEAKS